MKRVAFLCVLLLVGVVSVTWVSRDAAAQGGGSTWEWLNFVGSDGNRHDHPRWKDIGNNEVELDSAGGFINLAEAKIQPECKKAVIKFYKPGAFPKTWEATPALVIEAKDYPNNPTAWNKLTGQQQVSFNDGGNPKTKFPKGITVKVEIIMTIEQDGKSSDVVAEPTPFPKTDPF
jgi:hypothetical protein